MLPTLWQTLSKPKHQALVQGLGHWDWFAGSQSTIYPCDPNFKFPACRHGYVIAGELLAGFMTRYLHGRASLQPPLIADTGRRPLRLSNWEQRAPDCALKVRWSVSIIAKPKYQLTGDITLGNWVSPGW
jgi:hypothetical protein